MKVSTMIPLILTLSSLPTWGDTTFTQSNSRDYVITGHVVEETCTLSIPEMDRTGSLYLGVVYFGSERVMKSQTSVMNTVPSIGESLASKDMKLIVQCPAAMADTTITVNLSTLSEIDAGTKAMKESTTWPGHGQGDFGIKIHDKDNNQDIDFTTATASSLKLTLSTTDADSAQAEVNYQAILVRYGDRVTDVELSVDVVFNVAYE